MTKTKILDKVSGGLFFGGFMLAKLQYLPYPLVAAGFRFASLAFYLAAYAVWFLSSYLQDAHAEHKNEWYGFAKIKEQFLFSSFIGFTATVLSITAIFVPVLLLPAAWLFLLGNVIWAVGEYHKLKNPPKDSQLTPAQQKSYVNYAITSSVISLVSALAATLIFVCPPIALPLTIFSVLICVGLGALAFEFWLSSTFGNHEEEKGPTSSYDTMSHELNHALSSKNEPSKAPLHSNSLFSKTKSGIQDDRSIEMATLRKSTDSAEHDGQISCCTL